MVTENAQDTIEFGHKFAKKLKGGEVIGLIGDLGSGKTTFVKGLAEGLKVAEIITSPTFVILKVYPGKIGPSTSSGQVKKIEFVHVDSYRVENIDDVKSVGIEDYIGRNDVVMVVEWAEKIKEILPKKTLFLNFNHLTEDKREIEIQK